MEVKGAGDSPAFTSERVVIGRGTNWFWEPNSAAHVARYLFACSRIRCGRVLDAACGSGYGTSLLSRAADRVVGLDASDETIAYASANWSSPRVEFVLSDVRRIPLPDASFDAVVSFETIEHVPDPEVALAEIARVLRPDGLLLLSTPDRRVYNRVIPGPNPFHHAELDADELRALLRPSFQIGSLLVQMPRPVESQGAGPGLPPHAAGFPASRLPASLKNVLKLVSGPLLSRPALAVRVFPRLRRRFEPISGEPGASTYLVAVCRRR